MAKIISLHRYPVKSMDGESLKSVDLGSLGVIGDRNFMLVDDDGVFCTQRDLPQMTQLRAELNGRMLAISSPTETRTFEIKEQVEETLSVRIWKDTVEAGLVNTDINAWLSTELKKSVRLVRHYASTQRTKTTEEGLKLDISFPDGYPVHVISTNSLEDLYARIGKDETNFWRRFRPNLVIDALDAYQEDLLTRIQGLDFELSIVKSTGRCEIPNINPVTGIMDAPISKTLTSYRRRGASVLFGVYAFVSKKGKASVDEDLSYIFD